MMAKKRKGKKHKPRAKTPHTQVNKGGEWFKNPRLRATAAVIVAGLAAYALFQFRGELQTAIVGESAEQVLGITQPFGPLPEKTDHPVDFNDFMGSKSCAECHELEYERWAQSTHGRAGGRPSEITPVAAFDGKTLHYKDAAVTPVTQNDSTYIFQVARRNEAVKNVEVDAFVGGGHMIGGGTQASFQNFPDGTLRFLPFDYSFSDKTWFSQRKTDLHWLPIDTSQSLNEQLHWPPKFVMGTAPTLPNCQNCHASQLRLTFKPEIKKYQTQVKTFAINCESCHGPGKRHIELMRQPTTEHGRDIGLTALETTTKDQSLTVCFQCHAVKDAIRNDYLPGSRLEAYFSLKLPLFADNPFLPDMRVRTFGYQQNHLGSDCYLNGSMTCVDCHDPHTQGYRDIADKTLIGKFDNGQCTDCHPAKAVDLQKHTRHKIDSEGSLCTSCHMPFIQQKKIGTQVTYGRSDHTIPIPRPGFDEKFGLVNACSECHSDFSLEKTTRIFKKWYGEIKPHKPIIAALTEVQKYRTLEDLGRALLDGQDDFPMAQATGLAVLASNALTPDMQNVPFQIISRLKELSRSADLDLRAFALATLHLTRGHDPEITAFLARALADAGDDERPIRLRWGLILDFLGMRYLSGNRVEWALSAHRKSLAAHPEDPFVYVNLARALRTKNDDKLALTAYERAVEIDPNCIPARLALGSFHAEAGRHDAAVNAWQQAVERSPYNAKTHIALARFYVQQGEKDSAEKVLHKARALLPDDEEIKTYLKSIGEQG